MSEDKLESTLTATRNVEAEMCVLGAMLLSAPAAHTAKSTLSTGDFYLPAHQVIYQALSDLLDVNAPVDLVTVRNQLNTNKTLEVAGGEDYLIQVAESVPSASSVDHYAAIVREKSNRRRILQSSKELAEAAKNPEATISEVIAKAQEVSSSSASLMSRSVFAHISEIDVHMEREVGVTTGFDGLNSQISMGGWPAGQMSLVRAYHKGGKCLGRDTMVRMYDGTTKAVQDVCLGDMLMGPDSLPRRVVGTTSGTDNMYRINQARGHDSWVCNKEHILVHVNRQTGVVTEESVLKYMERPPENRSDLRMMCSGYDLPAADIMDPYVFGVWLGDGHTDDPRFTLHEDEVEIFDAIATFAGGFGVVPRVACTCGKAVTISISTGRKGPRGDFFKLIRRAAAGGKHVTEEYMLSSMQQRLELLAGIIDTDGHLHNNGYDVTLKQERLARQVVELAHSVGLNASVRECIREIKSIGFSGTYWRATIYGDAAIIPVRLPRKKAKPSRRNGRRQVSFTVEPLGVGEYFGFELAGDGLFLLADGTVTHNSTLLVQAALNAAQAGYNVLYATFADLHRRHIKRRFMRMLTGWQYPPDGGNLFDDWHSELNRLNEMPIDIYDTAEVDDGGSVEEFTAWCNSRIKSGKAWDLVLVDYAQELVSGSRKVHGKMEEQMECARVLNRLAVQSKMAVVVGSQITKDMMGGKRTKWGRDWEEKAGWVLTINPSELGGDPLISNIEISYSRFGPQAPRSTNIPVRFNSNLLCFEEM